MTKKKATKEKTKQYVNNKDFTSAIIEYVTHSNNEKENNPMVTPPMVTDYIATCFMKICDGLSHKPNFSGYTYRQDMVMDGVENCLRALPNFRIDIKTRSGTPNAFGYFTQIAYFAFLRRIEKENKEIRIVEKYIEDRGTDLFAIYDDGHSPTAAEMVSSRILKRKVKDVADNKEKTRNANPLSKESKKANEDNNTNIDFKNNTTIDDFFIGKNKNNIGNK